MTSTTSFATRLRQLRSAAGLNQQQLAGFARVAQTTISSWETGSSSPDVDELVRLARHFACTTDYMVGLSDHPQPIAPDTWIVDLELVEAIRAEKRPEHIKSTDSWAVVVPSRHQVLTSTQYSRLAQELAPHIERLSERQRRR